MVARRKDRLNALSEKLHSEHGVEIVVAPADLSMNTFMDDLKEFIDGREVGILINNAGFGYNGVFDEGDVSKFTDMIHVNCIAPTILTHHFLRQMKSKKRGAIIFLGSLVGYIPTPYTTTYSATKAFNLFMGEGLWYELREQNVDVMTLNPGGTDTEFQKVAKTFAGPMPRTVKEVVDTAMKSLGKKMSVVDGFKNKILSIVPKIITRKMSVKLAGRIRTKYYSSSSVK